MRRRLRRWRYGRASGGRGRCKTLSELCDIMVDRQAEFVFFERHVGGDGEMIGGLGRELCISLVPGSEHSISLDITWAR